MLYLIYLLNAQCTIEKFQTHFSLLGNKRPNRPHPARSEENVAGVAESVLDNSKESIRRCSQQLGLSYATTWGISRKDLSLKCLKRKFKLFLANGLL